MNNEPQTPGEAAYHAFFRHKGDGSFAPIPWHDLPEQVREAWETAAAKVKAMKDEAKHD